MCTWECSFGVFNPILLVLSTVCPRECSFGVFNPILLYVRSILYRVFSSLQKTELKTLVPVCREHTLVPPVGPLRPPNVESRVVRYMYTKSISPDLIHLPEGPSTLASLYHPS